MTTSRIIEKLKEKKEGLKIAYKLAVDFLVILFSATFLFLMAEGLIFGIASKNIGFIKIVFLIAFDILFIYILGNILELNIKNNNKKRILLILAVFLALLIFSGLIKINIFLAISIWLVVLVAGYKIFQLFFEKEN